MCIPFTGDLHLLEFERQQSVHNVGRRGGALARGTAEPKPGFQSWVKIWGWGAEDFLQFVA